MKRFRFGVLVNDSVPIARSSGEWKEFSRKVESFGFASLQMTDHFWAQLAPVPAIVAAAGATSELRVGAMMFANDFRHPAVLAKDIASLDLLCDGRLEFGLGAGWRDSDYDSTGILKDSPAERIDRLAEAVTVIKGAFGDTPYSFEGAHYVLKDFDCQPKPLQRPHPPLAIGGGGRRILSLAAREANIVGINRSLRAGAVGIDARRNSSARATDQKLGWIRDAAGDRFPDLELNMVVPNVRITKDRVGEAARLAPQYGLEPDEVLEVPHLWAGTVDQICDDLRARRERWNISYWMVQASDVEAAATIVSVLAGT